MRCAVLALSHRGAALSGRVRDSLDGEVDIYINEKYIASAPEGAKPYRRLSEYVGEIFFRYDALIFLSAAGIAVRMIAPHLAGKLEDPAVLVMDEGGRHIISLLSGHVGGANLLTRQLAASLGGEAVITTATDGEGILAPDAVASDLGLRPFPKKRIEEFNSALLEGQMVRYYVDDRLSQAEFYQMRLAAYHLPALRMARERFPREGLRVFVTAQWKDAGDGVLFLTPRRLIAGVGCRRGVPEELIRMALEAACGRIGRDISAVDVLASAEAKRDEAGLLSLAQGLGKELRFFGREELQGRIDAYGLRESPFVRKAIGVGNVCEAAALACVQKGRFALSKTKYGKVTVALVWEK